MGLAGSIFWIVIGVLYIIYMLYKESPGETIACIIACVVILSFFLIIGALLNSLTGWLLVLFVIVLCACFFLMAVYSVKLKADELDERNKRRYEYEEAKRIVDAELRDHPEKLEEWIARQPDSILSPLSKHPGRGLYWKKQTNTIWYKNLLDRYVISRQCEIMRDKEKGGSS